MPVSVVARLLKEKCLVCLKPVKGQARYCDEHRKLKYGNKPVVVDGERFDSKREAIRYAELRILQTSGAIRELRRQVPIEVQVNGVTVCKYVADFCYEEPHSLGWRLVVEDAKGVRTEAYKLKKKLIAAALGIEIRET